ncbi:MAG: BON domain-containing protein [Acidobacteria bacterium]|nr:BON domain-containing protein [Acidobacteriota bacterium]
MWNDIGLQNDVENEIFWQLNAATTQIRVAVKAGAVELAGHVDSYWEKCAAERAAWRVVHVNAVTNEIRVVLPFAMLRDDDDIALAAMTILEWNGLVPASVEVEVTGGCLTLTGTVERHEQKLEAERALSTLKGINGIRNNITFQPAAAPSEARAPIEAALKRSAVVDSSHVKVHVAHGVASLRGAVRSRVEYEEAIHAAWTAPGIVIVEDHLTIGAARHD